jgi:phosphoribosylformimino-5-aminoimidazole carboxamide ribonucleotide (ProFAR) isomerase
MGGQTVQLVGGREHALDAGDPLPIAERFAPCGEVAVIDLDAALSQGDNAALIEKLCARFRPSASSSSATR